MNELLLLSSVNDPKLVASYAKIALSNKLYVRGWMLKKTLDEMIKSVSTNEKFCISIAYIDELPVGCCVLDNERNFLQVYVKKEYRNMGLGTKLVRSLAEVNNTSNIFSYKKGQGCVGSDFFWDKALTLDRSNLYMKSF